MKGRSIDERPIAVEDRMEFGHWEIDTVKGNL
jgi:IS30 family transposase